MAQWVNRLQNNSFVNLPPLPLSCEISGALYLVQPGLMTGRLADEIQVNSENFKISYRLKYSGFHFVLTKVQHHYSLIKAIQQVFLDEAYCKFDF